MARRPEITRFTAGCTNGKPVLTIHEIKYGKEFPKAGDFPMELTVSSGGQAKTFSITKLPFIANIPFKANKLEFYVKDKSGVYSSNKTQSVTSKDCQCGKEVFVSSVCKNGEVFFDIRVGTKPVGTVSTSLYIKKYLSTDLFELVPDNKLFGEQLLKYSNSDVDLVVRFYFADGTFCDYPIVKHRVPKCGCSDDPLPYSIDCNTGTLTIYKSKYRVFIVEQREIGIGGGELTDFPAIIYISEAPVPNSTYIIKAVNEQSGCEYYHYFTMEEICPCNFSSKVSVVYYSSIASYLITAPTDVTWEIIDPDGKTLVKSGKGIGSFVPIKNEPYSVYFSQGTHCKFGPVIVDRHVLSVYYNCDFGLSLTSKYLNRWYDIYEVDTGRLLGTFKDGGQFLAHASVQNVKIQYKIVFRDNGATYYIEAPCCTYQINAVAKFGRPLDETIIKVTVHDITEQDILTTHSKACAGSRYFSIVESKVLNTINDKEWEITADRCCVNNITTENLTFKKKGLLNQDRNGCQTDYIPINKYYTAKFGLLDKDDPVLNLIFDEFIGTNITIEDKSPLEVHVLLENYALCGEYLFDYTNPCTGIVTTASIQLGSDTPVRFKYKLPILCDVCAFPDGYDLKIYNHRLVRPDGSIKNYSDFYKISYKDLKFFMRCPGFRNGEENR